MPETTEHRSRPRPPMWAIAAVLAFLVAAGAYALAIPDAKPMADVGASERPTGIVVGTPAGEVISQASPTPTPTASPSSTPDATATPTPVVAAATPEPATPEPPAPPPPPPAPPAPPPPTPQPTAAVVAIAGPADSVAAFYGAVAAGNFDSAYSLWSERMKATYPRAGNLDGRFADTASIEFTRLFVAEQGPVTATVQADFVETYDSGSSRQFVGYWELILVDGRWLLDAPHY